MDRKDYEKRSVISLRERTGNVSSSSKLVAFIYQLLGDYISPSDIERCVLDNTGPDSDKFIFTNGYLANYAKDIVERLSQ